ncbi:hypothetical protein NDU88_001838 [Pleurodeles waltl]|uniref:Uncharacterized protein n=1 Tax=Pleurodeles waltl TaxID=8319 RepID=A0AAV7UVH0_PLEWA|nr:hypothetical protein NDU88_001838 [Pleurodeles waltl]
MGHTPLHHSGMSGRQRIGGRGKDPQRNGAVYRVSHLGARFVDAHARYDLGIEIEEGHFQEAACFPRRRDMERGQQDGRTHKIDRVVEIPWTGTRSGFTEDAAAIGAMGTGNVRILQLIGQSIAPSTLRSYDRA